MLVHCDRCKKSVDGGYGGAFTYGFYDVSGGYWAKYARPYETTVCDCCMWCSPEYIADYGDMSCRSCK